MSKFKNFLQRLKSIKNVPTYLKVGLVLIGAAAGTTHLITINNYYVTPKVDESEIVNDSSIVNNDSVINDSIAIIEPDLEVVIPLTPEKKKIAFFNPSLKSESKKNVAYCIQNEEKLDKNIIRKLNKKSLTNGFFPVNLFNANSVSKFDELLFPSKKFINQFKLDKAVDLYFIASISQRPIPNSLDKRMYSSVIEIDGLLVNLKNNDQVPFNYEKIREMGMSQEEAHSNAIADFVDKVSKFVSDNY